MVGQIVLIVHQSGATTGVRAVRKGNVGGWLVCHVMVRSEGLNVWEGK